MIKKIFAFFMLFIIIFQPRNVFGLTCHNCYPGCNMVLDNDCNCGPGLYSTCQSEYRQGPAGACKNKNSEHKTAGQSNCAVCPEGTGTAENAPTAYRAFCITCYAGTYSELNNDGVKVCETCPKGYACIPKEDLVEPTNFFTCENFFMGANASGESNYTVWSSNLGDDCDARLVTGPGVGFDCTAGEIHVTSVDMEDDPDTEDVNEEVVEEVYDGGWKKVRQGNSLGDKVKKPLWYCRYESNRFGPGVFVKEQCSAGSYSYVNIEKYGAYTPSGILRGPTECRDCLPGSYSSSAGSSQCTLCKPGTYQDLGGQTSCKPCPQRTYQDEEGQANCKVCPDPWMTTKPVLSSDMSGAKSVDECNEPIRKMYFGVEDNSCSWDWSPSSAVEDGSFMQVLPNDKVKVNLKDTCVEETIGNCKVQD